MAETDDAPDGAGAEGETKPQARISILTQHVRDSSFENVAVQRGEGRSESKPDIQVNVNLDAKKRSETDYEVVLKISATSKAGEATMFIVELDYSGVFRVENVPERQLHPVLLIECPRLLFPFARRIVADLTRDGGYPPLMLDMVDFAGIYQRELQRRREAAKLEEETPAGEA